MNIVVRNGRLIDPASGTGSRTRLARLSDEAAEDLGESLYQDAGQAAVSKAALIPPAMQTFAQAAVQRALSDPKAVERLRLEAARLDLPWQRVALAGVGDGALLRR